MRWTTGCRQIVLWKISVQFYFCLCEVCESVVGVLAPKVQLLQQQTTGRFRSGSFVHLRETPFETDEKLKFDGAMDEGSAWRQEEAPRCVVIVNSSLQNSDLTKVLRCHHKVRGETQLQGSPTGQLSRVCPNF